MITPPLFSKLYNLEKQEPRSIDFDLQAFRNFAEGLGSPQNRMGRIIHVAGTNGKGSVCEILSQILTACGHKTGLYTSPHIKEVNERIKIDNVMINDDDFLEIEHFVYDKINGKLKSYRTFFEAITMLAFLYFEKSETDFVVIETGMGGRLDSTNIVDPDVSVITLIDYDHMHILGTTLPDIAGEKAGIIKHNRPVFTFSQQETVNRVLKERAHAMSAPIHFLDRESIINNGDEFTVNGNTFKAFSDTMFQRDNAALSTEILEYLGISKQCITDTLPSVKVQGRFEIVNDDPVIILDGSHNPSAIKTALIESRHNFPNRTLFTISTFMQDKDIDKNLDILKSYADRVAVSSFDFFRAAKREHFKHIEDIEYFETLEDAFLSFYAFRGEKMLLVTGSFYIINTMREIIGRYYH